MQFGATELAAGVADFTRAADAEVAADAFAVIQLARDCGHQVLAPMDE